MDIYELVQEGGYWNLRMENGRFFLSFITESEGLAFCTDLLEEIGGVLRTIDENGRIEEKKVCSEPNITQAVGCEPAGI